MLVAVDEAGPVAREVALDGAAASPVAWPIVVVTTPADASLAGTNPHATPLAPGTATVRALAFAPAGVTVVESRVDGGGWVPLQAAGGPVWEGTLVVPASGQHDLEVRATSTAGVASHAVTFSAP
jgi:hypothetical protein